MAVPINRGPVALVSLVPFDPWRKVYLFLVQWQDPPGSCPVSCMSPSVTACGLLGNHISNRSRVVLIPMTSSRKWLGVVSYRGGMTSCCSR